jgi:hypothetical protein
MGHSKTYQKVTEKVFGTRDVYNSVEKFPFLPVSVYK